MPGHEKIVSVRIAPARSWPTWSPTTVCTGRSAFQSAWRRTTAVCESPFASAVRMYSRESTSSRLARVMRAMIASGIVASASAGRTRWRSASASTGQFPCRAASRITKFVHGANAVPVPRRKPVGRTRSLTPKNQASMRPSQKRGIDAPVSAHRRARLSTIEFRHTAEATPIGMPRAMARTMAAVASSTVAGKRRSRSVATGSPRTIDTPRSPRSTLPTYSTKLKTRRDTPRSTGTTVRLRRMAYRLTALSSSARSARSARSALLELDRVEVLRPLRVRPVAFHALRERQGRLVVGDEEPPHVIMEHLLGLPVELGPLGLIREPLGAQEDVPQRLVRVEPLARDAGLAEEIAEEIVGIAVVPRPAEHVEGHLPVLPLVQVHRPLGRLQLGLDPDLGQVRGHRFGDLLRVWEIRARA